MNDKWWVGSTIETRSLSHDVCIRTPSCMRVGCQEGAGRASKSAMVPSVCACSKAARLRLAGPAPTAAVWKSGGGTVVISGSRDVGRTVGVRPRRGDRG